MPDEKAVLTDCLQALKEASEQYLRASLDTGGDGLRKHLSRIALDKVEQGNAVQNMLQQAGMVQDTPASADQVEGLLAEAKELLEKIGGASHPVARETGRSDLQ